MSESNVNLVNDSESNTYYVVGMWASPDSHLPPLAHDRMGKEVISLSDDSDSKMVYRNTLTEGASSFDSFEALFLDHGEGKDHVEVLMPPPAFPTLIEEKLQANKRMRECTDDFLQLYMKTVNVNPLMMKREPT